MRHGARTWALSCGASLLVFLLAAALGVHIAQRKMLFNNRFITKDQGKDEVQRAAISEFYKVSLNIGAEKPLIDYHGWRKWPMKMLGFGRTMTMGKPQETARIAIFQSVRKPIVEGGNTTDKLNTSIPTVLYLHGNTGRIQWGMKTWQLWEGYKRPVANTITLDSYTAVNFALVSYRGFGHTNFPVDVDPTQESIIDDAEIPAENIIIYGHSMGGSVAAHLAARVKEYKMLIIENSFTTLRHMIIPMRILSDYLLYPLQLDGWETITQIKTLTQGQSGGSTDDQKKPPIVFLHSISDPRVNVKFSKMMYDEAAKDGMKVLRYQCNSTTHSCTDSPQYTDEIIEIMQWAKNDHQISIELLHSKDHKNA